MSMRQLQVGIAVVLGIAVLGLFFIFNPFTDQNPLNPLETSDGGSLVAQDVVVGTGPVAQPGDMLTVNYTGRLENGTVFDTSVGKAPYRFTLGAGEVIPGWDQGLIGMQVGSKRILIVPASLGYGAGGYGPIPPNATLTFEIELLKITPASEIAPFPEGAAAQ